MQRRTYLGVVGGLATTLTVGCIGEADEPGENTVGDWSGGQIEFALPPFQDAEELETQYAGVFEWLSEGFDDVDAVEGVTTTSYSSVIESVVHGHTELANLSPLTYVLAAGEGVHPLAINWSHGRDSYRSYIATREETDIETLTDLEGRTVAMVDPLSTSGGMFPRYAISEAGLDAGDLENEPADFEIEWAFGHDAALAALENEHVDAAAYGDFQHPEDDAIVKVAETDPIPFDPVVCKPDTPEAVREAVAERLHETPDAYLEEHRIDRFGPVEDDTYDPVRAVADEMGVSVDVLDEAEAGD